MNVVEIVLISESNMGPHRPQYICDGQKITLKGDTGKIGGRKAELECLYKNRGVLSGPLLVYLIGDQKTKGKCWVKT